MVVVLRLGLKFFSYTEVCLNSYETVVVVWFFQVTGPGLYSPVSLLYCLLFEL